MRFDVVIAGGGIAGLTLANLLAAHSRLEIAVTEAEPPAAGPDELDLRVSALSPASLQLLEGLGVWPTDARRHCVYRNMVIWRGDMTDAGSLLRFSAAEIGVPELGCIVENLALRRALWASLERTANCTLIRATATLAARDADAMLLDCGDDAGGARLLVAADGARSRLREQLGVSLHERSYRQNAIVTHLATERPHESTAWQRFLPGGPLALLPLADGRVSLVWSHPEADTEALLALDDDAFAGRLTRESDAVLGALTCTTARAAFPLTRAHAEDYTGSRFALLGDAAHRLHPLAGQGANLSLRDAAVLAEELRGHLTSRFADPGDPVVLRRYERRRKGDNALMLGAMDALDALFRSPLAAAAGRGMGVVDRLGMVKAQLANHAMGVVRR